VEVNEHTCEKRNRNWGARQSFLISVTGADCQNGKAWTQYKSSLKGKGHPAPSQRHKNSHYSHHSYFEVYFEHSSEKKNLRSGA